MIVLKNVRGGFLIAPAYMGLTFWKYRFAGACYVMHWKFETLGM